MPIAIDYRPFQFANFSRSTLLVDISDVDVSLQVQLFDESLFPAVTPGQIFTLILSDEVGTEILYVTERASNVMTVERGKEGTTARAWTAGTDVIHSLTAGFFVAVMSPIPTSPVLTALPLGFTAGLSWTASVPGDGITIDGYEIWRQTNGGGYTLLTTVSGVTLDYDDTGLSTSNTYDYYIIATADVGNDSDPSNIESINTPVPQRLMVAAQAFGVYSNDAVTWTAGATSGVSDDHKDAVYHPGLSRWLMCGGASTGDTQYSDDDGLNWISQVTGTTENIERGAYAFGYFFIGSNNGGVWRSSTGLSGSWTEQQATRRSYDFWYDEALSRLISCGDNSGSGTSPGLIYTSDGVTWNAGSETGLPSGSSARRLLAVAYDWYRENYLVINGFGEIYRTDDIVAGTWTLMQTIDVPPGLEHCKFAIQPGGAIVVVTGAAGIWVSSDGGTSWTEQSASSTGRSVIWSEYLQLFIAVTNSSILTSPTGVTWTTQTEPSAGYGGIGKRDL